MVRDMRDMLSAFFLPFYTSFVSAVCAVFDNTRLHYNKHTCLWLVTCGVCVCVCVCALP